MRIVMMGTGMFALPTFEALLAAQEHVVGLVTQPDRPGGKLRGSTRQTGITLKDVAERQGIPSIQPEKINLPEGIEQLTRFQPDLLVVAAYGQILSPAVIRMPSLGAINVHASLLPKYRGASPIAHAIWNGERQTGVTIIRIQPGLDAGEMLAQEAVEIGPEETTGELEARLAPLGARLALEAIQQLKQGPVTGIAQDPALVTKAPKLTKEQGQIDWSQAAERIVWQVRAMNPWPTAYTYWHRPEKEPMRVIVNRCVALPERSGAIPLAPGTAVESAKPGQLLVQAGNGSFVEVLDIQPAGKKRMSATEFLRGYPIRDGVRLGPESLS